MALKKIVLSEYVSLDGVIENPRWTTPYWGDDIARFKFDEYRLLVYPVVLGSGQRLFTDESKATLKLVDTKTFSSGVTGLIYHPAPQA